MNISVQKKECEGGCGVIGIACKEKVKGKHLLPPLTQMCNRGNGKGGGIAASGLSSEALGVSAEILEKDYILSIAYLDAKVRSSLEKEYIFPHFDVDAIKSFSPKSPSFGYPEAVLYFIRVKGARQAAQADEIVFNQAQVINKAFYASLGEKKAFVLSNGKDLLIIKCVGYAGDAIVEYGLEELKAHVWIGHHRYPTKGKVWHPGGAHPFSGMHEALVHNGDFANYYSISEYLTGKNRPPIFLTDTEVSVLVFDLLHRTFKYPLEYVIEALAPTTERDFDLLPEEKKEIYKILQNTHIHASPDGPWFFLLAQSFFAKENLAHRLIGITDTSMLRPQVFALQKGEAPIGLAASEKQAIDACLKSLAKEDNRFWEKADFYWNARGGSYSDGGAFIFSVFPKEKKFGCFNKFGEELFRDRLNPYQAHITPSPSLLPSLPQTNLFMWAKQKMREASYEEAVGLMDSLVERGREDFEKALFVLTRLLDDIFPLWHMRRSFFHALLEKKITELLKKHTADTSFAIIDAETMPSEGEDALSRNIVEKYKKGFKKFLVYNCRGQRFIGCGLGSHSEGVRIDVYGSPGDYAASGLDGAEVHIHCSAQDQVGQIVKEGKIVVYGDVGQTFLYGAKGGIAYVRGNCAGRALINSVGKTRAVINGTALDYLCESFMAGHPIQGGGFVIVNGLGYDDDGNLVDLDNPYPGNNLFSLSSGGALYIRDPQKKISEGQLNGGVFMEMTTADWNVILPALEENASLFSIPLESLLQKKPFHEVYRKIAPAPRQDIQVEEAWIKVKN